MNYLFRKWVRAKTDCRFILSALLLIFLNDPTANADSIAIITVKSPRKISWNSPRSLVMSTWGASKNGQSHPIGHVWIEILCEKSDELPFVHRLTGMTSVGDEEERKLVWEQKVGMGILLHSFEGRLQTDLEISEEIMAFSKNARNRNALVEFTVNPLACRRAMQYLEEYEERNYGLSYGLMNEPLKGEGSGCTAFGVSFLEVAGILDEEINENWARSIRIPIGTIGTINRSINPADFFWPWNYTRWARADEPGIDIYLYDPNLIYNWIKKTWKMLKKNPKDGYERNQWYKDNFRGYGIRVDKSHLAVPTGPIWNLSE